jgi:hypothetical protein
MERKSLAMKVFAILAGASYPLSSSYNKMTKSNDSKYMACDLDVRPIVYAQH